MRRAAYLSQQDRYATALRRGLEYAAAIGLAMLAGYWIMRGRW